MKNEAQYQLAVAASKDAIDYCLTFFPFLAPYLKEPAFQKELEVARARLGRFTLDTNPETVIPMLEKAVYLIRIAVAAFRDADARHTADNFAVRANEIEERLAGLKS